MGYALVQKERETDKSQLFTMGQTAGAVGLTRSAITRLEERGLPTPAYVSPHGPRYC